jgi:hypothetical protein
MTHEYAGIAANMAIKTVDNYVFDSFEACHRFADEHKALGEGEWNIASNVNLKLVSHDGFKIDYYAIVLYRTEIVRYYPDGMFSVDNGGFNTPTTASRVTQFTPQGYDAYHAKHRMMLSGANTGHEIRFTNYRSK